MSGPIQQPTPIPDRAQEGGKKSHGKSDEIGLLPGPTPPGKLRQNNKEAHDVIHCCAPNPSIHTPRCSGTQQRYTMNILISLFIWRFMGLPCTLCKAGIIIPTLKMWNRGLATHGDSAPLMLLGPDQVGDTQAS